MVDLTDEERAAVTATMKRLALLMDEINWNTRFADLSERQVRAVIEEAAALKPSYGEIEIETVFDETRGHYELVYAGWIDQKRVHGAVIHIDARGDRIWIQHDGTSPGVAEALIERGVPEEHLVLAFHHPSLRDLAG